MAPALTTLSRITKEETGKSDLTANIEKIKLLNNNRKLTDIAYISTKFDFSSQAIFAHRNMNDTNNVPNQISGKHERPSILTNGKHEESSNSKLVTALSEIAPIKHLNDNDSKKDDKGNSLLIKTEEQEKTSQLDETTVNKRLRKVRGKFDSVSKRLKNLQLQQFLPHINTQLTHFVQTQKSRLQNAAVLPQQPLQTDMEHMKNLPTNELVKLVRNQQRNQKSNTNENAQIVKLETKQCDRIAELTSKLIYYAKHYRQRIDPEATDSSTDAESSDEGASFETGQESISKFKKIHVRNRAEYTWSKERASIAARWSWLRAQVSDLEYKVRNQSEIYKKLRKEKEPIILQEPAIVSKIINKPVKLETESNANDCRNEDISIEPFNPLNTCGKPTIPVPINGMKKHASKEFERVVVSEVSEQCARHKPLKFRLQKRRKLIRTCDISRLNNDKWPLLKIKANRPAMINCRCLEFVDHIMNNGNKSAPPVCFVCNGRRNHKAIINTQQSRAIRISLLDNAYHPVLSTSHQIPTSLIFNDLQRSGKLRKFQLAVKRDVSVTGISEKKRKAKVDKLKQPSSSLNSKTNSVALKIKNKYGKEGNKNWKRKIKSRSYRQSLNRYDSSVERRDSLTDDNQTPNRHRLSLSGSRKSESAFDINNIVIPHHMAACTRLERLNYKEISVPQWKVVETANKEMNYEDNQPVEKKAKFTLCSDDEDVDVTSTNSPIKLQIANKLIKPTDEDYIKDNTMTENFEKMLEEQEELERQRFIRLGSGTGAKKNIDSRRSSLCPQTPCDADEVEDLPTDNNIDNHDTDIMAVANVKLEPESQYNSLGLNLEDKEYDNTPYSFREFPLSVEEFSEMKSVDAAMANMSETNNIKLPARVSGARMDYVSSDEEEFAPYKSVKNLGASYDDDDGDDESDDNVMVEASGHSINQGDDTESDNDNDELLLNSSVSSKSSLNLKPLKINLKTATNNRKKHISNK